MWEKLLGTDLGRWVLAWRCAPGPLKDYYKVDTPVFDTPVDEANLLAVDIEATGLDSMQDEIVSIGFVPIVRGRILLAEAGYVVVRPERPVSEEAARTHGLLDGRLAEAARLEDVLPTFLQALTGRLPVAHHAPTEQAFLSRACEKLYGHPLLVPYLDTIAIERRRLDPGREGRGEGGLNLAACRERYNLPRYRAHDALSDAVAAAELFLAQAAHYGGRKAPALRDLMP